MRGKLRLPDRVAVRKKRILTPEQFRLLQMALRPPYDSIALLAVLSGLRKGEIDALRWNDVQFGRLEVDEAVYLRELGSPKSRKSRRRVTIGPAAQQALSDWRRRTRFTGSEDFIFGIGTTHPLIFTTSWPGTSSRRAGSSGSHSFLGTIFATPTQPGGAGRESRPRSCATNSVMSPCR